MSSLILEGYESFRRTHGVILGLLGVFISLWAVFYPSPFSLDGRWLLAATMFSLTIVAALLDLAIRLCARVRDLSQNLDAAVMLPKAIYAMKRSEELLVILEMSRLIGNDSVVSFYKKEGPFEILIGAGRVNTVQSDGRIQVVVLNTQNEIDFWSRVAGNDTSLLSEIIVRPSIPYHLFNTELIDA